ncbi:3-dehydroquinate synthase [Segetibacter sp. 3557_3]|uniref:3-dehydroquinate synthase n=1 Tax=Segetibacter sp. 3557_3 TaxID=2547429 RepID=UPI001058850A|nr:3-dehydroquinate synthase [Segetibacter sp. 3557_3]TDH29135.1 3-dehydroquinate synthase [Segetibacter sp. 3557_3]
MTKRSYTFSSSTVDYLFNASFADLSKLVPIEKGIIITDENIYKSHRKRFAGWKVIVLQAGEQYKVQSTVDNVINQLIEMGADRKSVIIGVGGGVVTDLAGYVAGVYMRGIKCGFVPTSILSIVDAAIGGKNGVDVGVYKNLVGLIRQPSFLLFDFSFLKTLPKEEWINGFAEVIKHACIKDAKMFKLLQENNLGSFRKDEKLLQSLILKNVLIKTKVVISDEFENGDRKLLNFGHTMGHAIENLYKIPHGHAVSIGMGVACNVSTKITGFRDTDAVKTVLKKYGLPPDFQFDKDEALRILRSDKKKDNDAISYVVLDKIGKARTVVLQFAELDEMVRSL